MSYAYPAPTKTNLLKEKRSLILALQGYDLLEKKREILVIELLKRMDELGLLEKEIQALTDKAYVHLRKMLLAVGRERALALSSKPVRSISLKTMNVNVSGMNLPTIVA